MRKYPGPDIFGYNLKALTHSTLIVRSAHAGHVYINTLADMGMDRSRANFFFFFGRNSFSGPKTQKYRH